MFHLAVAFHIRSSPIREVPSPSEIGGYTIATDAKFDSVFANAGGMYMQANLRGQETETDGNRWTPLGVVGKSGEPVRPVTNASPAPSTAMA